jgi:hypothetical protein
VQRQNFHICRGEQKRGQTTEQLGCRVAGLHPQTCCRVSPVTPGHPTRYDRVQGLGVASHPCSDTSKVGATRGAQDTNMLSLRGEREGCSIHDDGADFLPVVSRVVTLGMEEEQLGLLQNIDHTSGGGEGLRQVKQGLQGMGVRGHQAHVISDTNGSHTGLSHVEAQASIVGDNEFLIVGQLELVTRVDPALLYSSLVLYGAHEGGGELEEGAPGSQPVGHVEQALVSLVASSRVGFRENVLLQY